MKPSTSASTEFVGVTTSADQLAVDLLFLPVFQDADDLADVTGLDAATGGEVGRARSRGEFLAKLYDIFLTPASAGAWRAGRVALVGAGRLEDFAPERIRRVAAACGHYARKRRVTSIGFLVRRVATPVRASQCVADGLVQAEFEIGAYKHDGAPGPAPARAVVAAPGADEAKIAEAVRRGRIIGRAANLAKSLANEPGNVLTPREFAVRVSAAAEAAGLAVDVLDESRIRERGMGLLLGVAQGSAEPPRVIVIRHDPPGAPATPVIGLIGKGVTFDSGGISIKPAEGMERMKSDMSGGAAVAGAMCALAELGAACRVVAVIPTTENMPGGHAIRPGDVLTGASGKTVEVINTDAEGRLILGDALWYAQELGATHLVDVATLTGACMVALGRTVTGLFGQPDAWVQTVEQAAARAGDRVWHMPIYEEALEQLRSEIADLLNSGGRMGGAVTAAAFLREFAGGRPWAHLDIAGPAWAETKEPYQPKGPTGVAVRVLIELGMTRGGSNPAPGD
ncbi:MAG TPA: leucyl aminopeptidase [Vicinamibacterales bacterium]|nr:leucyl aminopeptidase [Vicinamibacterales bacterium]